MLDAARTLISAKGDEFTTQDLVTEGGVALQTFYRYFSSKDELLLAVIGDAMVDAAPVGGGRRRAARPTGTSAVHAVATLERLDGDA